MPRRSPALNPSGRHRRCCARRGAARPARGVVVRAQRRHGQPGRRGNGRDRIGQFAVELRPPPDRPHRVFLGQRDGARVGLGHPHDQDRAELACPLARHGQQRVPNSPTPVRGMHARVRDQVRTLCASAAQPQHLIGHSRALVARGPVEHDDGVAFQVELGISELLGTVVGVVVQVTPVDLLDRGQQFGPPPGVVGAHRTAAQSGPERRREDRQGHGRDARTSRLEHAHGLHPATRGRKPGDSRAGDGRLAGVRDCGGGLLLRPPPRPRSP